MFDDCNTGSCRDVDVRLGDFEFAENITRPGQAVMETLIVVIVEVAIFAPDI